MMPGGNYRHFLLYGLEDKKVVVLLKLRQSLVEPYIFVDCHYFISV